MGLARKNQNSQARGNYRHQFRQVRGMWACSLVESVAQSFDFDTAGEGAMWG